MISVLLPTYNSAAVLGYSIRSILKQTFREYELLILDDGSTDRTESLVSPIKDTRIRYVKYPHRGLSETLNAGLREAKYDVIARMDAGDISLPDRFKKQYAYLSSCNSNTIVACRYAIFENNRIKYLVPVANESSRIKQRLALHVDFVHSGVMYSKNVVLSHGGYRNVPLEDYDLWLRIKNSVEYFIVDEVLQFVEYTSGRLSTSNVPQKYRNQYSIQAPYYLNIEEEFGITRANDKLILFGWREYFYGDKKAARRYWGKLSFSVFLFPRIVVAWLCTYFPDSILIRIKEIRIKFVILYLLKYFTIECRVLRKEFKHARLR